MAPSSGHPEYCIPSTAVAAAGSYHYLRTRSALPGPVTSLRLLSSPRNQTGSSDPADTAHTHSQNPVGSGGQGRCHRSTAHAHLVEGFGPVRARDVPQVTSVLYLVVSDLLVFQPHDAVPELSLICRCSWSHFRNARKWIDPSKSSKLYINTKQIMKLPVPN